MGEVLFLPQVWFGSGSGHSLTAYPVAMLAMIPHWAKRSAKSDYRHRHAIVIVEVLRSCEGLDFLKRCALHWALRCLDCLQS